MRNGRAAAAFFEATPHGECPMPALALALILSLALAGCVSSGAPGGSTRGYENTPSGGIVPGQRGY